MPGRGRQRSRSPQAAKVAGGAAARYALATRLAQVSDHPLSLNQGTLYPALVRLEQKGWIKGAWHKTESNREAKYHSITTDAGAEGRLTAC